MTTDCDENNSDDTASSSSRGDSSGESTESSKENVTQNTGRLNPILTQQNSASNFSILEKRVAPIARKPFIPRQSEEITDRVDDDAAESKNKQEACEVDKPMTKSKEKIKRSFKVELEKRIMFRRVRPNRMDYFGLEFFNRSEDAIRADIGELNHAERFWLAEKFSRLIDTKEVENVTKKKVCEMFGILRTSIQYYNSKHKGMTSANFDGYSPFEFMNLNSNFHLSVVEKLALNYDSLIADGILKIKK